MKKMESVLPLHGEVADVDMGAVGPLTDLVVAEDGNQADGKPVGKAVIDVGERAESVDVRSAVARARRIVEALRDYVVEIRLDQDMTGRQGVGGGREERSSPPGVVQRLMNDRRRDRSLLGWSKACGHRQQDKRFPDESEHVNFGWPSSIPFRR